jgi:hypothetical protein
MKIYTIIAFIFILFHFSVSAQNNEKKLNQKVTRNMVYFDLGAGFYVVNVGINYERIIFSDKGSNISFKGSYGLYSYLIPEGDYYSIASHYSYGRRFVNFETAIGVSFKDREGHIKPLKFKNMQTYPLFYLGCKLKKPTGNYVMKIGIGYPQIISWGFGVAF